MLSYRQVVDVIIVYSCGEILSNHCKDNMCAYFINMKCN